MSIKEAVEDYIADRDRELAPQAMKSATHGAYLQLALSAAENKPILADVDVNRRYLSGTATGYPITDRSRATLAAYARQPGAVQVISEELGLAM